MKNTRKYNIYHGVVAGGRWVLFAIVSFIILFPVYWIFISSITPSGELFKTPIDYLPDHPTLESYKFLIENVGLLSKVGNTVLIVGLTLVISTVLCAMAAYGFSRFTTKGINIAFAFIIATMLIPEVVTARPLYEFMQKVKLYDTYPGLILLYISTVIPFTVLILRNFVGEIPISLEEAAAIDGCSPEGTFFRIILPLLKPVIVTVTILNGMWIWNDYLLPSLMLGQNGKVKTLPVAVQAFVGSYVKQWDLILTAALLAMIPMIIVFLLAQKQIMNGMVEGAIK